MGHRPLLLRPGARADGRLLYRARAATCGSSTSSARIRSTTRAPRACISRSGRRTPGGSAWSATSTPGTAGATCMRQRRDTGDLGDLPARRRRRRGLQVRDHRPGRRAAAAEGRSLRPRLRAPARHRLGGRARARARLGRRRRTGRTGRRPTPAATPISIYEVHAGIVAAGAGGRRLPELGRARPSG